MNEFKKVVQFIHDFRLDVMDDVSPIEFDESPVLLCNCALVFSLAMLKANTARGDKEFWGTLEGVPQVPNTNGNLKCGENHFKLTLYDAKETVILSYDCTVTVKDEVDTIEVCSIDLLKGSPKVWGVAVLNVDTNYSVNLII